MPERIQLRRTKGWRMPSDTVKVSRPSKWGNPFTVAEYGRELAVRNYRNRMEGMRQIGALDLSELRGKNLACWCKPGEPCHADVLLELANDPNSAGAVGDPLECRVGRHTTRLARNHDGTGLLHGPETYMATDRQRLPPMAGQHDQRRARTEGCAVLRRRKMPAVWRDPACDAHAAQPPKSAARVAGPPGLSCCAALPEKLK